MPPDPDRPLSLLADAGEPTGLADIDSAVLRRIAADRTARGTGVSMACVAAVGAVTLGLLATGPGGQPAAAGGLSPDLALAPSTLLVGR